MSKHHATVGEMRSMQMKDLSREIRSLRTEVAQLRIATQLGKEKNSSKYFAAKKQLARMLTVLRSKEIQLPLTPSAA